jgi:DNA-binding XRE family transcriptional regulator
VPFCCIRLKARKPPNTAYPQQLKTLGDHLRKRRLDLGLLQKEVAKKIGVNKSTITNWELNHNFPELRFISAIIEFLGYWPYVTEADNLSQQIVAKRTRLGLSQKEPTRILGGDPKSLDRGEQDKGQP